MLCKLCFALAFGAVLGGERKVSSAQNGFQGEGVELLTLCVGVPVKRSTVMFATACHLYLSLDLPYVLGQWLPTVLAPKTHFLKTIFYQDPPTFTRLKNRNLERNVVFMNDNQPLPPCIYTC